MRKNCIIAGGVFILGLVLAAQSFAQVSAPLEKLDIFFLRTQNDADCMVLQCGSQAMLIDTGEESDGPYISAFLKERKIERIAYLVLTHYDKDHIGSVPLFLSEFKVDMVVEPFYSKPHESLARINGLFRQKKIPVTIPIKRRYLTFSNLRIVLYPPRERSYRNDNNYSMAVLGTYGNTHMLFTGDAIGKRVRELMDMEWPPIELYKIPYHGRAGRSSAAFIARLKPVYAVVTASRSDSAISAACAAAGTQVFYTGGGNIHFTSDGFTLKPVYEDNDE